ncbi:MAG: NUDIX domain-containing protein [archaeon]|nr:NUDIX domain-containing protein [archaeon]
MKEKTRIVAIIIQNNSILFVKGSDKYKELWSPGGKPENNETDIECLKRELHEELSVKLVSAKFFKEYIVQSPYATDVMTKSRAYLVDISGKPTPGKEIQSFVWITKKEYEQKKYSLLNVEQNKIIPDLIKSGYF